jgi:DNA-binding transcriptional LysR family regulator
MVWHPEVNVHIEYFSSERIYELVLAGEVDIGLVAVPKQQKWLNVYDFQDEPLVLVCSIEHPLADKSRVDIHTVRSERFIAFEKNVPTRLLIDSILQRYGVVIQPVMEFDNIETIKRAVEINAGVSILPKTAITQELAAGTIKAITFSNENFVRPTGIIIRKGRVLSQASRYFIELLRKKI